MTLSRSEAGDLGVVRTTSGDLNVGCWTRGIGLSGVRNGEVLEFVFWDIMNDDLVNSGDEVLDVDEMDEGDGVSILGGGISIMGLIATKTEAAAMTLGGYLASL